MKAAYIICVHLRILLLLKNQNKLLSNINHADYKDAITQGKVQVKHTIPYPNLTSVSRSEILNSFICC